MLLGQGRRQAGRFATENQNIARLISHIEITPLAELAEEIRLAATQTLHQRSPIVDHLPLEVLPVVQASPAEIVIVDPEAERTHEPQLGAGRHAGAADRTGIVRNLRLVQNNVQQRFVRHRQGRRMKDERPAGLPHHNTTVYPNFTS